MKSSLAANAIKPEKDIFLKELIVKTTQGKGRIIIIQNTKINLIKIYALILNN